MLFACRKNVQLKRKGFGNHHSDICENCLSKVDKNLYLSDSLECVADDDGEVVYSKQTVSFVSVKIC